MANQWGRDSGLQSGRKRGSGVLSVIGIVVALAVGAAGGYAASHFSQADSTAAADTAGAQSAELNKALRAAREELKAARAREASSAAEVEELKADIARMAADLDTMAEKLATNSGPVETSADGNAAIEAISDERDLLAAENQTLKSSLAALEAERDRLQQEITMMLTDQATLRERIEQASDAKAADADVIDGLQKRLAAAERSLKIAQEATEDTNAMTAESAVPATVPEQQGRPATSPRDRDAVAAALRSAPGLEALSDEERQTLSGRLVEGECVTSALESVFERVPILTLRDLIRDLNSDC